MHRNGISYTIKTNRLEKGFVYYKNKLFLNSSYKVKVYIRLIRAKIMEYREAFKSEGADSHISASALQDLFLEIADQEGLTENQILPVILYWGGRRESIGGDIFRLNMLGADDPQKVRNRVDGVRSMVRLLDAVGAPYDFAVQAKDRGNVFDFEIVGDTRPLESLDTDLDVSHGLNFGYPSCCIQAFVGERENGASGRYDRLQKMRKRHPSEAAYVLHIPCAGDCEPTLALARDYQGFTRRNFPILADYLEANCGK